jgi:hypothetical protein
MTAVVGWRTMLATEATERQIDTWTGRGWLAGTRPGSGRRREWSATEVPVARLMVRLIRAGLTPEAAHRAARSRLAGPATVDLGDGITLTVDAPPPWPPHADPVPTNGAEIAVRQVPLWAELGPDDTTLANVLPELRPIHDRTQRWGLEDPDEPDDDGDYIPRLITAQIRDGLL